MRRVLWFRRGQRLRVPRRTLGVIVLSLIGCAVCAVPLHAVTAPTPPAAVQTALASGNLPTVSGAQQTAFASGTFPAMSGGGPGGFSGGTPSSAQQTAFASGTFPASGGIPTPSRAQQTALAGGTFPAMSGGLPGGMPFTGPVTATATTSTSTSSGACTPLTPTTTYAAAAFGTQRDAGEALVKNFWGPAETAGLQEAYKEASGGQRLVQYFDKGRMELADSASGKVTFGLLATELITGQIQTGASSFQSKAPPAIAIAGDPDGGGPTYAALAGSAASLLAGTDAKTGTLAKTTVSGGGSVTAGDGGTGNGPTALSVYDGATRHNVPQAFATFREKVGVSTVGYATSEPFLATVKVGGVSKQVMIQVFERRVLTYTAENTADFQVEMGNIGQHYYQWRYCT